MPNKHAAIKDLAKNRKHAAANARIKTNVKQLFKKGSELLKQGSKDEAQKIIVAFQKAADKAAKNHVMSRNAANRKKSNLMKALAK